MRARRWIAGSLALLLAACSGSRAGWLPSPALPDAFANAPAGAKAYAFAPYVDTSSGMSFEKNALETGTRYYTMAFVQSYEANGKHECLGAWNVTQLPSSPSAAAYFKAQLAAIRKLGGDGIVSFGGAAGLELAQVCADAASLEKAYATIVDDYGFTHLDFDIEGADVDDLPALHRRWQALAALEKHYAALGHPVAISLTLPVEPVGLPADVANVVASALKAGVKVSVVNVMTMDFGDYYAPNPAGKMGHYAIEAAQTAVKQLRAMHFPLSPNPYASLGVTPMIGQNDAKDEIFELSDAKELLAWAQSVGLGRIAYWAAQRDKACTGAPPPSASDSCSGIPQTPGEFSKIFSVY